MKLLSTILALAISTLAMASTFADEDMNDLDSTREQWACAANNVKGSGPYWGKGTTQGSAQTEALRVCNEHSTFRCWPVPDSCSIVDADL